MNKPSQLTRLVNALGKLPGIGEKSAERITFYLLKVSSENTRELIEAIKAITEVKRCPKCFNFTTGEKPCDICNDTYRDKSVLCVVEEATDLWMLEQTGAYKGLYHILMGRIAPLEGIGPDNLTIKPLMERLKNNQIKEVILATNPTLEGDSTAAYLRDRLSAFNKIKVTQLSRGIPVGSIIAYASRPMLTEALRHRNIETGSEW